MNKNINLSVPNLKGNELKYVKSAILSEWVSTNGPYVLEFENKIAEYVGSKGAVSCQNGTSGIHLALKVCGIEKNDEVLVPTLTFIAAVNPVKYVGAEPIFMDCDDSLSIDVSKLKSFCELECIFSNDKLINKKTNNHIKGIIVVHVFGNIADMETILDLSRKYNLKIIEDSTEALGSKYIKGKFAGKFAGTIGDVGVYSFNGNKIITTGGGGMIVSNNIAYLNLAKHLSTQAKTDDIYYTHDMIGYNYRMTNIQAALGLAQLEQLENFIKLKTKNYFKYKKLIENIPGLKFLEFSENIRSNYWFYSLYIQSNYKLNRDQLIKYLASKKIQSRPIWGLINEQKPYKDSQSYKITKAKYYIDNIINIPCSTNLSQKDLEYVVECLKNA
jgi:perosamine synthetase